MARLASATMSSPIEVTAAVIVRDRQVLVCQRAGNSAHHPGKWEFPGGKREAGESLEECLRRELEEELAIDAEVGGIVATSRHHYEGRGWVELSFFAVRRFRGVPTNRVFADMRWIPTTDLMQLDFLEGDREIVRRLAAGELELPG